MDIFGKFSAVTEQSLYDFYGIASIEIGSLEPDERDIIDCYLKQMQKVYMEALRKRFAHWNPNGNKAMSVEDMIKQLKDSLYDEAAKQAQKMSAGIGGFDMMSAVRQMRGETVESRKTAESAATKQFADNLSKFDKDKYPKIAKGVIKLHEAHSSQEIILAIDYVNDLSHWGGSLLCDFVAGRRAPDDPDGNRVFMEVMEIKKNAKSPLEFASKMSSDIRKIVQEAEKNKRAGL